MVFRKRGDKEQTVGYSKEKGKATWFQRPEGTERPWVDTGEEWADPYKTNKGGWLKWFLWGVVAVVLTAVIILINM